MSNYRYHYVNDYQLRMTDTYTRDNSGHCKVAYRLQSPERLTLFEGSDFGASPLHDALGKDNAMALLSFLTLRPGDTDSEYFDAYTVEQMEFARSSACEALQLEVSLYEERKQTRSK